MTDSFSAFEEAATRLARQLAQHGRASQAGEGPAITQLPIEELAMRLDAARYLAEGGLSGPALQGFFDAYLANSTRLHHPGYMAHQVSTPNLQTPLAALAEAFTNNGMNIYEMGPAAATLEYVLLNWMLGKVGWSPAPWPRQPGWGHGHGAGILTHGGSLANLTALLCARAHAFPDAWQKGCDGRPVVLAPTTNHYSISRAVGIMGLGTDALIHLPVDEAERIRPDQLTPMFQRCLDEGQTPFALVANGCATATGYYDPLEPIADFCQERGIWLHVDGAHGASALVSQRLRTYLAGIERADSLVWDAHKMLAVPGLCAALLVREAPKLYQALRQDASYLFHDKDQPGFDFIAHTVECTKTAMSLRLFMALAEGGEAGAARHVEHLYDMAQLAYRLIIDRPGFSSPLLPQANIVLFRYLDDDALQLKLRTRLVEAGRHYFSTTLFRGKRYLRLALMNPATHRQTILEMLDEIEKAYDTEK